MKQSKTYEQVVDEILAKGKFGEAPGAYDIRKWMEILGPVDEGLKVIHIAGTNGKGSTSAMVSNILAAGGYTVGLFTSPHLTHFTERIRLVSSKKSDGGITPVEMITEMEISRSDLVRLSAKYLEDDRLPRGNMLDYTLMVAISYFKEKNVDYVVLETGLGGKLDSTNGLTVTPLVAAITSISLEHTAILGDTIEQIASEKAGIIKHGTKAVIGYMSDEAARVVEEVCRNQKVSYERINNLQDGLISLGYQRRNEACARAIIRALNLSVSKEAIDYGIRETKWPGRLEILSEKNPWIMLDGAHNPEGVAVLRESLETAFPGEKYVFIIGVLRDRKYEEMIRTILPVSSEIWTLTPKDERAMTAEELASVVEKLSKEMGINIPVFPWNIADAAGRAQREENRKVVAFGSLYFIGELRDEISIKN